MFACQNNLFTEPDSCTRGGPGISLQGTAAVSHRAINSESIAAPEGLGGAAEASSERSHPSEGVQPRSAW